MRYRVLLALASAVVASARLFAADTPALAPPKNFVNPPLKCMAGYTRINEYPIVAWCFHGRGCPGYTAEYARQAEMSGFNTLIDAERMVPVVEQFERMMILVPSFKASPEKLKSHVLEKYGASPRLIGIILDDDTVNFRGSAPGAKYLAEKYPYLVPYVSGNPDRTGQSKTPMRVLGSQNYSMYHGGSIASYCGCLTADGSLGNRRNMSFWPIYEAPIAANRYRFEVYAALAHGAQGMICFAYAPGDRWPQWKAPDGWLAQVVRPANLYARKVAGKYIWGTRCLGVYHSAADAELPHGEHHAGDGQVVRRMDRQLLAGLLVPEKDFYGWKGDRAPDYAMIVDKRTAKDEVRAGTRTARTCFAPPVTHVEVLTKELAEGDVKLRTIEPGFCVPLELIPGEGRLVRLNPDLTPVLGDLAAKYIDICRRAADDAHRDADALVRDADALLAAAKDPQARDAIARLVAALKELGKPAEKTNASQTPAPPPVADKSSAPRIDRRAPAEKATRPYQTPAAHGAAANADWTMMKAWDHGASDLSQTGQLVRPAGETLRLGDRVFDLALARNGKFLIAKTDNHLDVIDARRFVLVNRYPYFSAPPGKFAGRASMHGLTVAADGVTVFCTETERRLLIGTLDDEGKLVKRTVIKLARDDQWVDPLGVALTADGKQALVALAIPNQLAVVDLAAGKVTARIPVGDCPYGVVLAPDGRTAFVSNFGGDRARPGDTTEKSAGTDVAVDERGVALRGSVSVVDLAAGKAVAEIATPIHPEAMTLSPDGKRLYVVDASGDGLSVIDVAQRAIVGEFDTKPRPDLPYGSLTDGLALSADGNTLYAANAGNNSIALLDARRPGASPFAFVAAGGFPGCVCVDGRQLYIGNVLGEYGDVQKVDLPDQDEQRSALTRAAERNFHFAEIVRTQAQAHAGLRARAVPVRPGEPSTIRHVVYILKENKKFDQMLGDMGRGNCEPRFCEYPRAIIPNHHAIADQYVLLDNYYCGGVCSADGHQWAMQGLSSVVREKDWANAHTSYDFGIDPLCYAGCGFIWDHLLRHGVSFRNFGEMDYPLQPRGTLWRDNYRAWKTKSEKLPFTCVYRVATLRRYSDLRFPGWEMNIPDQYRVDVFLNALAEFERAGQMPEFVILYLPNDHTTGGAADHPTPRAYLADNDLAVGRALEGLSKSRFWKDMVVFVNEDDPQTGADHVDGHRSLCLLAGPYVKRGGTVVSRFYNQASVLHTICNIFGVPPMNQSVAIAPTMEDCFQASPDFAPYRCLPETVPLDELNPTPRQARSRTQAQLISQVQNFDFSQPDQLGKNALLFSRYNWSTVRGDEPFPVEYSGAHGKGLAALGLKLTGDDDDDD